MGRKWGIAVLIACFGLSGLNTGWAAQIVEIPPVIVQPYDLRELNQQMLEQDRINRDEELAIKGLIDDNQRLVDSALTVKQDATLEKINQTMVNYRNYLMLRDQARIAANGQRVSRYDDLINLTRDVDGVKGVGQALQLKTDVIDQKFKILNDLKNEMMLLNSKLKSPQLSEGPVQTSPGQEAKIRMLTQRLAQMDQKISRYDEILAQKDQQIALLKGQVNLLKSELQNKIIQENNQVVQDEVRKTGHRYVQGQAQIEEQARELKAGVESIRWLNQELVLSKDKAQYFRLTARQYLLSLRQIQGEEQAALKTQQDLKDQLLDKENQIVKMKADFQRDDRVKLAHELIELQGKETALLDEKNKLETAQNAFFDRQALVLQSRLEELTGELNQKSRQVDSLKAELLNKIAQQKDQLVLEEQIHDLKLQLQDKESRINALTARIRSEQEPQLQADALKQQLADQQSHADSLKQELNSKNFQLDKMTAMIEDYQKKMESRNASYNDLYARLKETQTSDLSLSMVQQKAMEDKIKGFRGSIHGLKAVNIRQAGEVKSLKMELAMARLELEGVPSRDEIDFLRTGLEKARVQLKQKDETILQLKANAAEYMKEYKKQFKEFQSLTDQLLDARQEIDRRDEDLKYKDLEVARLKTFVPKERKSKSHGDKLNGLRLQLMKADAQIKSLRSEVNQLESLSKSDPAEEKLKQALDKIDEQGRMINVLVQKLQDAGQTVDLSRVGRQG